MRPAYGLYPCIASALVLFIVLVGLLTSPALEPFKYALRLGPTLDSFCTDVDIPVVVVARNNPTMIRLLVQQLRDCFDARVIVLDDASDFPPMLEYLSSLASDERVSVVRAESAGGPHSWFRSPLHPALLALPRFFAYTDADLRLGSDLPRNFLCVLAHLSQRLNVPKVGLALDLSDAERMWPQADFYGAHSVWGWENNFWGASVEVPGWPGFGAQRVFRAAVDTTFAVYDKALLSCSNDEYPSQPCFTAKNAVRVAGSFSAKHRPWYPAALAVLPQEELYAMFAPPNRGSVASMLNRLGLFGNVTQQASARELLEKWSTGQQAYQKADDLMGYKCTLEGEDGGAGMRAGIPGGFTTLRPPVANSMLLAK